MPPPKNQLLLANPLKKNPPKNHHPENDPLDEYAAKRDFASTPEPDAAADANAGDEFRFVIHDHAARSHHFDLRLEINGVLASWAVPKGLPTNSKENRLAIHVEDHPLAYRHFEGTIPKGNYGAGTIKIDDSGTWQPVGADWYEEFLKGKLKFRLIGSRQPATYLMVRKRDGPEWFLKRIKTVAASHQQSDEEPRVPSYVSPQLAAPGRTLPVTEDWIHELKLDGYRLCIVKSESEVRIFTRNQHDWSDRFPGLVSACREMPHPKLVLDGEAVVFGSGGITDFGALQSALADGDDSEISFVIFDLLHLNGCNLEQLELSERLKLLDSVLPESVGPLRRSRTWPGPHGPELFEQSCEVGLEGIISKPLNRCYHPGSRKDWIKTKCKLRQEFVVYGYTPPKTKSDGFGALLVASRENGKWVRRGRVGTGFNRRNRVELVKKMAPLRSDDPPLPPLPEDKETIWIKPELVVELEATALTRAGSLRHASFVGIREDKSAQSVRLESSGADKIAGLVISHPDRLVIPEKHMTKLDIASHYDQVADWLVPWLRGRPVSLLRVPDSIHGQVFFQKSFKTGIPSGVKQRDEPAGNTLILIPNRKALIALVQFGTVEFHAWNASLPNLERPDQIIWDLDPHPNVPWSEVLGTAFLLRDFLLEKNLEPIVKFSGGKGIHIVLNVRRTGDWTQMKQFSKAVAAAIAKMNPDRLTIKSSLAGRTGKIYIDWLRNSRGATCCVPWCLRARPGAGVSLPVTWDQLAATATSSNPPDTSKMPFQNPPLEWLEPTTFTIPKALLADPNLA